MDFALSSDQQMIRESAQEFLAEASGSEAVREAMATERGFLPPFWQQLGQELGWCGIHIPEEHGGVGLSCVELVLLLEQMGYHLACAPFFSSVVLAGNALLHAASAAARAAMLPALAAGELQLTLAWAGLDGQNDEAPTVVARRDGDRFRLQGHVPYVLDGASAELLLIPAQLDGKPDVLDLFAVPAGSKGLQREPLESLDQTRRFADIRLNDVQLDAEASIGEPGAVARGLRRSRELARIALAAEQLGGAQRCLDMTVAYTQERVQFGRPIASFQAVKHRCAEMMVQIEATRSAVLGAAATAAAAQVDEQTLAMEAAVAKSLASETYFFCAQEAIQLHGGVGFTWEYDPHLYFKRAQASAAWLGRSDALFAGLASRLLDWV